MGILFNQRDAKLVQRWVFAVFVLPGTIANPEFAWPTWLKISPYRSLLLLKSSKGRRCLKDLEREDYILSGEWVWIQQKSQASCNRVQVLINCWTDAIAFGQVEVDYGNTNKAHASKVKSDRFSAYSWGWAHPNEASNNSALDHPLLEDLVHHMGWRQVHRSIITVKIFPSERSPCSIPCHQQLFIQR